VQSLMNPIPDARPHYPNGPGPLADLKRRVTATYGPIPKGGGLTHGLKSLAILGWAVGSYLFLIFVAAAPWQVLLGTLSLGLAVAGVGFNIMHDGGHESISRSRLGNKLAAMSLDLVGASSYMWARKHYLHHHFPNVEKVDSDVEQSPFLRLTPWQEVRALHRFQHLYAWFFYAVMGVKWQLYDDFRDLVSGKMGGQPIERPRGKELVIFFAGKLLLVFTLFVIPMSFHPPWLVLAVYMGAMAVAGVVLSTVFQIGHCFEGTTFTESPGAAPAPERTWLIQQAETTANFVPRVPGINWYFGGLNYQIEHHFFPRVSHVHYKKMAPAVEAACKDLGVQYKMYRGVLPAIAAHVRFLKQMGRAETPEAAVEKPLAA
jgi:linoleoyl-CoA desaturase